MGEFQAFDGLVETVCRHIPEVMADGSAVDRERIRCALKDRPRTLDEIVKSYGPVPRGCAVSISIIVAALTWAFWSWLGLFIVAALLLVYEGARLGLRPGRLARRTALTSGEQEIVYKAWLAAGSPPVFEPTARRCPKCQSGRLLQMVHVSVQYRPEQIGLGSKAIRFKVEVEDTRTVITFLKCDTCDYEQ